MKHVPVDLSAVPLHEWIRLAAFIDGEGTISLKAPGTAFVYVKVSNTRPELMAWLFRMFGGRVQKDARSKKPNSRRRDTYTWIVDRDYAIEILRYCAPHFILKGQQAEVAFAIRATVQKQGGVNHLTQVIKLRRSSLQSRLRVLNSKGTSNVAVGE